ncbi:MAG: hypothetical protein ACR2RL_13010 [Gammaproteobacteria bacterium]
MIAYRSPAQLEAEAEVVVLASIVSARLDGTSFRGRQYAYTIEVDSFERGSVEDPELAVTYEDLMVHKRAGRTVCPLKHGSGIEHDLKIGRRYRIFLRSAEYPEILLAEELAGPSASQDELSK